MCSTRHGVSCWCCLLRITSHQALSETTAALDREKTARATLDLLLVEMKKQNGQLKFDAFKVEELRLSLEREREMLSLKQQAQARCVAALLFYCARVCLLNSRPVAAYCLAGLKLHSKLPRQSPLLQSTNASTGLCSES